MIDNKQIEDALKNISELKKALNNNLESLKSAFISKPFVNAILGALILFSLSTILCIICYAIYGSISAAPVIFKYAIITFSILSFIYIGYKKITIIKDIDGQSIRKLYKNKAFSHLYLNVSIILFTTFALFLILLHKFDAPWLLLPLLVIAYGACLIISANALGVFEIKISGYLVLALGLITAYFFQSSILLWSMIDISIILFLIYLGIFISYKKSK
ncbi:MAG: hypothetical protein JJE21_09315 [Spirochaetaceae bacterium]|nr:hypothetical protein [Spirochaetaceae bacterium]